MYSAVRSPRIQARRYKVSKNSCPAQLPISALALAKLSFGNIIQNSNARRVQPNRESVRTALNCKTPIFGISTALMTLANSIPALDCRIPTNFIPGVCVAVQPEAMLLDPHLYGTTSAVAESL
jgi:hypothetical protein